MAVVTGAHWFGPDGRPLLGWVSRPPDDSARPRPGVVIVPPLAYELWTTHRTLRTLAERLAADGRVVLRFDLSGTGDSAGVAQEIGDLTRWSGDVAAAVAEVRRLGASSVTVVGLRFGALLALAAPVDVTDVVAWWPPESARAHVREQRLLSTTGPDGDRFVAGIAITDGLAAAAAALDPAAGAAGRTVFLVDRDDRRPVETLAAAWRSAGADVHVAVVPGVERCLDTATERATVPEEAISTIASWLAERETTAAAAADERGVAPALRDAATFPVAEGGLLVRERVLQLTAADLVAIETAPAADQRSGAAQPATVVFVNSGSEHHVGPGRSWVELGRQLAAEGRRALRVDFRGWGESPDGGHAPGRPFDAHTVDDVASIAASLAGGPPLVLAGLCAGAWSVLRRCEHLPIAGVLAINPPLYWEPGDHIEATMAETRIRVERERPRMERLERWRMWTLADVVRWPVRGARWLARLATAGPHVWIVCTPDDDGREHLLRQLARPLRRARRSPTFRFVELPTLDHSVHHPWARHELLDELRALLHRVENADDPPRTGEGAAGRGGSSADQ